MGAGREISLRCGLLIGYTDLLNYVKLLEIRRVALNRKAGSCRYTNVISNLP